METSIAEADARLEGLPKNDADVKEIVTSSPAWKREAAWQDRGGWVLEDVFRLRVRLLVAFDGAFVVVRRVDLVKDHAPADQIEAYPMDGLRDDVDALRLIPNGKVH